MARVYSRAGLNPEDPAAAEGSGSGGAGATLFDALARQAVARIEAAELQDVLRWGGGPVKWWWGVGEVSLGGGVAARCLLVVWRKDAGDERMLVTHAPCMHHLPRARPPWHARQHACNAAPPMPSHPSNAAPLPGARLMTAFHQMGLQPEQLLAAVERWADERLRLLPPQALSLALWSFARMGSSSPVLLQAAASCAEQRLLDFSPAQLAQVAWALAKLRWPAARVLRYAGAQLAERTSEFGGKEAANVLWALASEVGPPAQLLRPAMPQLLLQACACAAGCGACQTGGLPACIAG